MPIVVSVETPAKITHDLLREAAIIAHNRVSGCSELTHLHAVNLAAAAAIHRIQDQPMAQRAAQQVIYRSLEGNIRHTFAWCIAAVNSQDDDSLGVYWLTAERGRIVVEHPQSLNIPVQYDTGHWSGDEKPEPGSVECSRKICEILTRRLNELYLN
jgi:hypothetical protein